MRNYRYDDSDDLDGGDEQDEPTFQRLKKQTGKTQTPKGDRRQHEKEWGRAISKFLKQHKKNGKP